jgi:GSH-dependent disulfide-bond oxidoreductase
LACRCVWQPEEKKDRLKLAYAIDHYVNETNRLYGVLYKRLADRAFVAGDYSIADMAIYPWILPHENQGQKLGANRREWWR